MSRILLAQIVADRNRAQALASNAQEVPTEGPDYDMATGTREEDENAQSLNMNDMIVEDYLISSSPPKERDPMSSPPSPR